MKKNKDNVTTEFVIQLKDAIAIQCSDGNWNYDPYMHGMANGMIYALSVVENKDPQYLTAPDKWLAKPDRLALLEKVLEKAEKYSGWHNPGCPKYTYPETWCNCGLVELLESIQEARRGEGEK